MDLAKYNYFLAKYRAVETEDLDAFAEDLSSLAEEAAEALRAVLIERGKAAPLISKETEEERKPTEPADPALQAKLASALWNSASAKHVHSLAAAQGLVFSYSLLGPQGLRFGALWVFLLAVAMTTAGFLVGTKITRAICANGDTTIEHKASTLRKLGILLWPVALLSALAGVLLARVLRGA